MYSFLLLGLLPLLAAAAPSAASGALVDKRSISCLAVGSTATATWTNSAGKTCRFTGVVGSNFGTNAAGGEYSCNGRCGAGCSGAALGNVYTQDCWSHDICSYFENASGGASDKNCGSAFNSAVDDTLGGWAAGCGQTNPSLPVSKPGGGPVCS